MADQLLDGITAEVPIEDPRSLPTDGGRYYSLYRPSLARLNESTAAMGQFAILFGERFEVPACWGLKAKELRLALLNYRTRQQLDHHYPVSSARRWSGPTTAKTHTHKRIDPFRGLRPCGCR